MQFLTQDDLRQLTVASLEPSLSGRVSFKSITVCDTKSFKYYSAQLGFLLTGLEK
jgi:hypothetical protein